MKIQQCAHADISKFRFDRIRSPSLDTRSYRSSSVTLHFANNCTHITDELFYGIQFLALIGNITSNKCTLLQYVSYNSNIQTLKCFDLDGSFSGIKNINLHIKIMLYLPENDSWRLETWWSFNDLITNYIWQQCAYSGLFITKLTAISTLGFISSPNRSISKVHRNSKNVKVLIQL